MAKKKVAAESGPVINQSYELVATERLLPHPRNVNRGDLAAIGGSIAENGFYGAIVAQKSTGHILAGNHRYDAAKATGIAEVPVTWVDVDDDRALRILLADNRTTRLGHDDQEALAALLQEILADTQTLAGTGFDETALDELLAEVGVTECEPEGLTDEDAVPEPLSFPITEPGDLWVLGKHRLLCGDSTSMDAVERLMDGAPADAVYTDPPYGIKVVGKNGKVGGDNLAKNGVYASIIGDDTTDTAIDAYNLCAGLGVPVLILWGGNYFADKLPASSCWIVWDKRGDMASNNFADCELAWTNLGKPARVYKQVWSGMIKEGESGKRVHPTQKPVALAEWCLEQFAPGSKTVLELFLGSGSSLIACEKTNRSCYGVEMSQDYCDVIVKRWQDFTGKEAVLESDGRKFNEIAAERQPATAAA